MRQRRTAVLFEVGAWAASPGFRNWTIRVDATTAATGSRTS
jgi:hypothetical protein